MAKTAAFGALNIAPGYIPATQPQDTNGLLQSIDASLKALVAEYVAPKVFRVIPFTSIAVGGVVGPFLSDGVPINRLEIQVFTTSGLISIMYSNTASPTDTPHQQIGQNSFPTIIPIPGIPVDFYLRNDGTVVATGCVIISSASG